ncbi:uncharacterized protein [Tenebrio molitor]|uniref:uncharacterized protein isoform X3 n=1 Tax=Tenebrio molitor TaxID=7067 RepID=UPI0036248433
MDAVGGSCYSLNIVENAKRIREEKEREDKFNETLGSCGSLSRYESKTFKNLLPQMLASSAAALFHVVVGISLAYSAILLPQLDSEDSDLKITKDQGAWIASVITITIPVSGMTCGFLMDSVGRLNTIKLAMVPAVAGWIVIATSRSVTMMIIGRIITGFAAAWGTSPAMVYITEIARADMRGSLMSFAPAYTSLGMDAELADRGVGVQRVRIGTVCLGHVHPREPRVVGGERPQRAGQEGSGLVQQVPTPHPEREPDLRPAPVRVPRQGARGEGEEPVEQRRALGEDQRVLQAHRVQAAVDPFGVVRLPAVLRHLHHPLLLDHLLQGGGQRHGPLLRVHLDRRGALLHVDREHVHVEDLLQEDLDHRRFRRHGRVHVRLRPLHVLDQRRCDNSQLGAGRGHPLVRGHVDGGAALHPLDHDGRALPHRDPGGGAQHRLQLRLLHHVPLHPELQLAH